MKKVRATFLLCFDNKAQNNEDRCVQKVKKYQRKFNDICKKNLNEHVKT